MHSTQDSITPSQLVWPLPGTKVPNGHLMWGEWAAYQAANLARARHAKSQQVARTLPVRQRVAIALDHFSMHDALAHFIWPLPATMLPNGRLTWAEWLDVQAKGLGQPIQAASERAA